jgi:cystathionine gamma-synthase
VYRAHLALVTRFLYVDTFKVLEKVLKINTTLYGHASASELDALEASLQNGTQKVHALVIEVPQNPLLGTPDLQRIRRLASTFDFLLIIDDTASTPVNTNTLYFGDIVVTSLSKMFSGACNVMGGSVVVNPQSSCAAELRALLTAAYCDVYFPPDAAIMELNSRDFSFRLEQATRNAAQVCSLLRAHPCVSHVYYPLGSASQCFYDMCKTPSGGYGFLLSLKFQLPAQAIAFFDAFDVAKGPSLGTNFTLACPYTLLAHYNELEWAANYGVDEHLVRISVGLEDYEVLRTKIEFALKKCNL